MPQLYQRLQQLEKSIAQDSFLRNQGLANEVGIHIFCYKPEEQPALDAWLRQAETAQNRPFRLIERDLYDIFLKLCEEKRILPKIPQIERTKGGDYLLHQLQQFATPEAFVAHMEYAPHQYGDILLITGVGKVYPFMRVHMILNNLQHVFSDIPVLVLYPGKFDGQDLRLFDSFLDEHYYRAFNLIAPDRDE